MNEPAAKHEEYYFEISNRENSHSGWHQEQEIVFVLKGKGMLRSEDQFLTHPIQEGDIFAIGGYEMHEIRMDSGGLTLSLFLSPRFISFYFPETEGNAFDCKSYLFPPEEQNRFDMLRADFACAFQAFYQAEAHHAALHLRSKIIFLVDDLIRYFAVSAKKEPALSKNREHLRTATDWIDRHYAEDIALKDIASRVYLSESYLSRLFKQTLGITFTDYLTQVRLDYSVLLLRGGLSVTEVASDSGFHSINTFIQSFKQVFGKTPGQYKKELYELQNRDFSSKKKISVDKFSVLRRYMRKEARPEPHKPMEVLDEREVCGNLSGQLRPLTHNWKKLINVGYARDLLNAAVQKQIRQIQSEIGFRFARVKGILDDDMLFYELAGGEPVYHFTYADEALDFLLSAGLTPFLELGTMPSLLAKNRFAIFKRQSIHSLPKDMARWKEIITALLRHFIHRYGTERVEQWLFTPCFNPFFSDVQSDHLEEYFQFYRESFRAVRSVLPYGKICGPGDVSFPELMDRCIAEDCVPDIVAVHAFFTASPETEGRNIKLLNSGETFPLAVTGDEDYLKHCFARVKRVLYDRGLGGLPVMLDEWNNSFWQRDLCNDTCYKSASLFKNILENDSSFCAMGYWTISDFMEELSPSSDLFFGGFGLFTRNGLVKSGYRAMQLLCRQGDTLVWQQDGCLISTSGEGVQIFLYNTAYYDLLYRFRHTSRITATKRYDVFNKRNPQCFRIRLQGLLPGSYTMSRYSISREGGSVFDAWVDMGAPSDITEEVRAFLESRSYPVLKTSTVEAGEEMEIQAMLQPHEVQLITLSALG